MRISDWSSDVCSSDLLDHEVFAALFLDAQHRVLAFEILARGTLDGAAVYPREVVKAALRQQAARSEEHTSELQSLMRISYAVFCLKKKKKSTTNTYYEKTNASPHQPQKQHHVYTYVSCRVC